MENEKQSANTLCRAGCGFFGSVATEGMCSKCFKGAIKKATPVQSASNAVTNSSNQAAPHKKIKLSDFADDVSQSGSSVASEVVKAGSTELDESAKPNISEPDACPMTKNNPNRCQMCNKKVGLTGFSCRCGGIYCSEHRYDTAHNCQFDYKSTAREELRKNNPVVVSDKIQRI